MLTKKDESVSVIMMSTSAKMLNIEQRGGGGGGIMLMSDLQQIRYKRCRDKVKWKKHQESLTQLARIVARLIFMKIKE